MYSSVRVANRFLELAKDADNPLTSMQVLKLVYIAHGWSLGVRGNPLIIENVQAWQYGPVIPELYEAVKDYRGRHITEPLAGPFGPDKTEIDKTSDSYIRRTYELYGHYSGPALSRLTHRDGSPWSKVYDGKFGRVIPVDLIEDHYAMLKRSRDQRS